MEPNMFKVHSNTRSWILILPVLLLSFFFQTAMGQQPLVVFLVRHAEKIDSSKNPALSPAGKTRATSIARTLEDANIKFVHSTDYLRTKETAAPIAEKTRLKIYLYDAGNLPSLVQKLKRKGGRHLVVGHSNTTPKLAQLLGGEPGPKIDENEYDRLYIISIFKNGSTNTIRMRLGEG